MILWKKVRSFDFQIHIKYKLIFLPQRQHNTNIMQTSKLQKSHIHQQRIINNWRIYLNEIYIRDITTISGNMIYDFVYNGTHPVNSTYTWMNITKPSTQSLTICKRYLQKFNIHPKSTLLKQKLGKWYDNHNHISYINYIHPINNTIYNTTNNLTDIYTPRMKRNIWKYDHTLPIIECINYNKLIPIKIKKYHWERKYKVSKGKQQ